MLNVLLKMNIKKCEEMMGPTLSLRHRSGVSVRGRNCQTRTAEMVATALRQDRQASLGTSPALIARRSSL
jgi:hypothetical protein